MLCGVCHSVCPIRPLQPRATGLLLRDRRQETSIDRGSVQLSWRCDMLCTSGYMDDVIFAHNGPYLRGRSTALQGVTSLRRRAQAIAPLVRRIGYVVSIV